MPSCRDIRRSLFLGCALAWLLPVSVNAQMVQSPPTAMPPSDSAPQGQPAFDPSMAAPAPFGNAPPGGVPGILPLQEYSPDQDGFTWQLLPDGLMYRSYLAGEREPRFGTEIVHDEHMGGLWSTTLGGRAGILRWGNEDPLSPEGVQVDIEGAAFPLLQLNYERSLADVDFRFGVPVTMRAGPWETKVEIYHLCSHLGDQYLLDNPGVTRINFSRDALLFGLAYHPVEDVRVYGEVGWAFYTWGETEPWEFQFGFEYSPARPTGLQGAPFFAANAHLRQEVNFGGAATVQTGWQWRGRTGHLFRLGLEYLNGKSEQYQFSDKSEQQIGGGVWYDF
jgi:hypothetical protein